MLQVKKDENWEEFFMDDTTKELRQIFQEPNKIFYSMWQVEKNHREKFENMTATFENGSLFTHLLPYQKSSDVDPHWSYADPDPVRIQSNKITKFISNNLLKVKKVIFSNLSYTLEFSYFLGSDLKNIISLHFIPLDPDPWTQMNADPIGSTSQA